MAITRGTVQATTSGTAFDFTGLPSSLNRITILFDGVSVDGTDSLLVQIGDSGGIEATGYDSASGEFTGSGTVGEATSTSGFIARFGSAGRAFSGHMVLHRITGNVWVSGHSMSSGSGTYGASSGGGTKSLSAELDQVRLTRTGTDNFDAGQVNIFYE